MCLFFSIIKRDIFSLLCFIKLNVLSDLCLYQNICSAFLFHKKHNTNIFCNDNILLVCIANSKDPLLLVSFINDQKKKMSHDRVPLFANEMYDKIICKAILTIKIITITTVVCIKSSNCKVNHKFSVLIQYKWLKIIGKIT